MGVVLSTIYTENFNCVSPSVLNDDMSDEETNFVIYSRIDAKIVTIEFESESDSESRGLDS